MSSGLLKPLGVFCSQSQSQRYIKTIRNLSDAWRSPAEKPLTESDKNSALVETNFGFVLKITNAVEEQQSEPTTVEMSTHEPPISTTSVSTTTFHANRISPALSSDEGDCMLEAEEVLSSCPLSVLESYDAWVDTYTGNFKERRDKTQNYHATVFPTTSSEVAWNVTGFLLAWRITMAPEVGRIEFSAGCSKYFLEKGKETSVT
ncbi:hypothetical protein N7499_006061 [Penicillium canescens]|nr:hypothetical protein N7499_006061 [Penicillium canescens]KAJ6177016.1 hypothetical protein N7485_003930 [Penicillium canescens]